MKTLKTIKLALTKESWESMVLAAYAGDEDWAIDMMEEVMEGIKPSNPFYIKDYHAPLKQFTIAQLEGFQDAWIERFNPENMKAMFLSLCRHISNDEIEEIFEDIQEEFPDYPGSFNLMPDKQISWALNYLLGDGPCHLQGVDYDFSKWVNYDAYVAPEIKAK